MLSHHDRRRLEAIERHLVSDDPRLAERFHRWTPSRASRWAAFGQVLMIVIGSLGTLAGTLLLSPSVFLVFLAVLVGGCVGMARRTRPGARRPGRPR